MDFADALRLLRGGAKIARAGWNGRGMHLRLVPGVRNARLLPYIEMTTVQGELVPWLASQTDMLADDWHMLVEETRLVPRIPAVIGETGCSVNEAPRKPQRDPGDEDEGKSSVAREAARALREARRP